jgi:predicted Zn-dependent protease
MGQLEKARMALEQVIARSPRPEPLAHLGLASVSLERGDAERASAALIAARAAWGGGSPPAAWYHYAGIEAAMRGEPERAASILAEGAGRYPASPALLNNLSVAREACGNLSGAREAEEAYQKAAAAIAAASR